MRLAAEIPLPRWLTPRISLDYSACPLMQWLTEHASVGLARRTRMVRMEMQRRKRISLKRREHYFGVRKP